MTAPTQSPTSPPTGWATGLLQTAAVTVLSAVAGLLFWAGAPALAGWEPRVVVSGSMAPGIVAGDVVVVSRLPAGQLRPGQVVLFSDVGRGGDQTLHRMVGRDGDALVTRGDANASDDAFPVQAQDVLGVGRLRIPLVGVPLVWVHEQRFLQLALFAVGGAAVIRLAAGGPSRGRHRRPSTSLPPGFRA